MWPFASHSASKAGDTLGMRDVLVESVDDVAFERSVDVGGDGCGERVSDLGSRVHPRTGECEDWTVLLDAIDHVQLAMPSGGEELATWFYEGVLGVPRIPKPPHLAIRGGCWFEHGHLRIHLGVQDDFVPATKAHPAFAVSDLDQLEQDLMLAGSVGRAEGRGRGPAALRARPVRQPPRVPSGAPGRPTGAEYADTVVSVAAASVGDRLARQLDFVQELDRLKTVQRQSFILDGERRENTAEHSWHVAMLAAGVRRSRSR